MRDSRATRLSQFFRLMVGIFFWASINGSFAKGQVPMYGGDPGSRSTDHSETAVLAGGCFWGVDAVFKHVKGVKSVVSGYSGGSATTADYETVSTGSTGHAESVKIIFDPTQVSYSDLLRVFFSVATDPTQLNRQGPDEGTQYRSAIFFTNDEQKRIAFEYINQLNNAHIFSKPIVTKVDSFRAFYPAEEYHQNFLARHPDNPYIVQNDLPKLYKLQKQFPDLYRK